VQKLSRNSSYSVVYITAISAKPIVIL